MNIYIYIYIYVCMEIVLEWLDNFFKNKSKISMSTQYVYAEYATTGQWPFFSDDNENIL